MSIDVIEYVLLKPSSRPPKRSNEFAVGWDLKTIEELVLYPFKPLLIPLGFSMACGFGSTGK